MEMLAKLKIELTGSKSFYLFNGTEQYYKKLRAAYQDIKNDIKSEYLYFSFFTLCAATLEYSLNYILADYCIEKFGIDNYRTYLEEYINLKFKNKLLMIPHIISDGKLMMNEDTTAFKKLCELINLRNKLLHNKEFLNEFLLPLNFKQENGNLIIPKGEENIDFSFEVKDNPIDLLNKTNCLAYGIAMGDFKKYIMKPAIDTGLEPNKMIRTN
jgi:hypothetical protein